MRVEPQQIGPGDCRHGRGPAGPAQQRHLTEELADTEPDVLLFALDLDLDLAGGDEIHRTRCVAGPHHHFPGLDDLCPQQFHNVRDFRGIKLRE